jgi:hypothetical protein
VTTAAFIAIHEWIVHNCLSTLHIEAEVHFVDVLAPHRLADIALEFRFAIKKQESSPAALMLGSDRSRGYAWK